MLMMEESWRVLFEAKAFQERAWLEARMRVKMEEMQSLILDEVEWKMHSLMNLFIEQERRAGPGLNSSAYMSWTMSSEDGARLELWRREEEELRERKRKLWEAKPSVSLQQVEVRQTPALDLQVADAHLRDDREVRKAREGVAEEWKTIENEKKKMERRREIRDRTAKLEKEQLQEERKALDKEWKNIEKEKRKIEEEREELERKAKAQEQRLEKEEKRLESEAREREEALQKKIEVEQKEVESQKEQLLQEKTKLKEKVVRERRTVATDKKRMKDEWEKVAEERRRVEKERKELKQKEEELQRTEEINKKQREYEALMKEMEKEKQKIETTRKKMMEEKTQRGNEEGEKESDEVKLKTEITETAIKEEKANEVAQGKTEEANLHDGRNSWDSDESNQEESSQPKANSNIALMKAISQRSAQENEDNSSWDSDEEVANPRNTKAARAPTIPKATVPLKSGNASKVPVKNTCAQKQSKASSDAQLVDKLEEIEKELESMPDNRKSTAATSFQKATIPVKHGSMCSAPVKKNTYSKKQSKGEVDPDLFDKELEELEKDLAAGPSNSKPTASTNVQSVTIPVKHGNTSSVPVKTNTCAKKHSKALDDDDGDFSDDLFDTDLQEKKTIKKSAKEDPVDTDAIVRELERLNYEFKEPKGRTMSSYERKSKDSPNKSLSKAMTGNKPTDVNANEAQNRKPNSLLFPQDAIHLKYLKGRRF